MSLIVNKGISVDGYTAYLIDETTAYGGVLPARNTLAVIPYLIKADDESVIIESAADYEVDSTFGFNVTNNDSVLLGYLFAIPKQTGGGGLVDGDIIFDLADRLIKKMVGAVLTTVNVSTLVDEASVEKGSIYTIVTTALTIKRDVLELDKLIKLEEYLSDECEYNEFVVKDTNYNYVRTLRAAAFIEFAKPSYLVAQQKLDTANSFADTVIAQINQDAA